MRNNFQYGRWRAENQCQACTDKGSEDPHQCEWKFVKKSQMLCMNAATESSTEKHINKPYSDKFCWRWQMFMCNTIFSLLFFLFKYCNIPVNYEHWSLCFGLKLLGLHFCIVGFLLWIPVVNLLFFSPTEEQGSWLNQLISKIIFWSSQFSCSYNLFQYTVLRCY